MIFEVDSLKIVRIELNVHMSSSLVIACSYSPKPRGYKTFFMLIWPEHAFSLHVLINCTMVKQIFSRLKALRCCIFFPLINTKMPTIVGILTFISMIKYMLSLVGHENSFISSKPG